MGLILDSSILIADERGKFDLVSFLESRSGEHAFISAITVSELRQGILRAAEGPRRNNRARHVDFCLARYKAIPFDAPIARRHAELWAELESRGQRIGAHDMIIAATALYLGFQVATANLGEFNQVSDLILADASPFFR